MEFSIKIFGLFKQKNSFTINVKKIHLGNIWRWDSNQ